MSGGGYDYSSSTFSPDGRIFQVEYASKAVEKSGTALGVQCSDGIVLAVEKPIVSKMLLPTSSRRIHTVDAHAGVAITGFVSDGRQIVSRAREESANYFQTYGVRMSPKVLADRLGHYVHYFTCHGALRPFGSSAIVAAYDEATDDYGLYMVEPSGIAYKYYGCVAGKGRQSCKTELEKLPLTSKQQVVVDETSSSSITCKEAVKQLARMIQLLHEDDDEDDKMKREFELEMSWICNESNHQHVAVPKQTIHEALQWARQDIINAEAESGDEDGDDDDEMQE